jgi:hypothetical protein
MATITIQAKIDPRTKTGVLVRDLAEKIHNGDTIVIKAPKDTSIVVMFPPCRDPLLIGNTTIEAGKSLTMVVYAPEGKYPFTIYFNALNTMIIRDQSGPEIEIQ